MKSIKEDGGMQFGWGRVVWPALSREVGESSREGNVWVDS